MNAIQLFTHRLPSSGIHLLSDPFPERRNGMTPFFRTETLSSQRAYFVVSKRPRTQTLTKK